MKVIVKDVGPKLDGEYPLDLNGFTNRELHTIKQISGVRAGEFVESLTALDNDLLLAFAVIVLQRAGKPIAVEQLWELPSLEAITIDADEEEAEEELDPPPAPPELVAVPRDDENSASSGPSSSGDSDHQEKTLASTGAQT